jgi:hypothetical protein
MQLTYSLSLAKARVGKRASNELHQKSLKLNSLTPFKSFAFLSRRAEAKSNYCETNYLRTRVTRITRPHNWLLTALFVNWEARMKPASGHLIHCQHLYDYSFIVNRGSPSLPRDYSHLQTASYDSEAKNWAADGKLKSSQL